MFAVVRLVNDNISKVVPVKFLFDENCEKSVYCYYNRDFSVDRPEQSMIKVLYSKTFEEHPRIYRVYLKKKFGKLILFNLLLLNHLGCNIC